jgi:sarcosine oxidase subunit gamma
MIETTIVARGGLAVRQAQSLAHLMLHCDPVDAPKIGREIGMPLSPEMLRAQGFGRWHVLHLSPDEWLFIGPVGQAAELEARLAAASRETALSLVDISDRSLAIEISGAASPDLLAAGCPLDLDHARFPEGSCSRTLFGKVPVMLWRVGAGPTFRMEYARSYDNYVLDLICAAAADLPHRTEN